jgi:hypothetical protein
MNIKSTGVRENSDGSVGRESEAPPAGRSLRRRSRRISYSTAFESCGALRRKKDRREALRFPALRVRQRFCAHASAGRKPAPQENHHDANDATECNGPAALPEKVVNRFSGVTGAKHRKFLLPVTCSLPSKKSLDDAHIKTNTN